MTVSTAALKDMATRLRIHSIESTSAAGSGHPTSCCSMADVTAALFFEAMKYHVDDPRNPANDRFVLSKGHSAPILYAAWAEAGQFPVSELKNLRELTSDLEGHPTPRLPFVDVATGSLGQGLSAAAGMAYAAKNWESHGARIYCLMGDGETAEGSVWEAASFASHYKLDNLCGIVDVNRLGQSEATMFQHHMEIYQARFASFGWHAIVLDGHDMAAIQKAFAEAAATKGKPTMLLAKTFKGGGIPGIEDKDDWHGKALGDKTAAAVSHLKGLLTGAADGLKPIKPATKPPAFAKKKVTLAAPNYKLGDKVATRVAYGTALTKLAAASPDAVALDGDTKNSTYSIKMKDADPKRYVECFIAEQNLVGVGIGMATRGKIPFVSTFAAFFSRAYDQIRMGAPSMAQAKFVGSHVGVSIGEDGPSQMALEDIAMFRAVQGMTVLYPSDAVSAERAIELAANTPGMVFVRTSRPANAVVYGNDEPFALGKCKCLKQSKDDKIMLVGGGVTLHEALAAAETLAKDGIHARVVDLFSVKPIDRAGLLKHAGESGNLVLTVEDHYPEGGIGDAVAGELAETGVKVHKLAIRELPRSGKPDELVDHFGISARHIVAKAKSLLGKT